MVEHRLKQSMGLFLMSCQVELSIRAEAEIVWRLLTNAEAVSRWNSTVTQIEGQIREGERLRIRVQARIVFSLQPFPASYLTSA